MQERVDPFRHQPELRDLITDPANSFFRTFTPADADEAMLANGLGPDWRHPDDLRNRMLDEFLATLPKGDLWVFAYGSLIWDPGVYFTEIRKAYAPGFSRKFILYEKGGRGSSDNPAVMAALDRGDGCEGVVLCLDAKTLATELDHIWRREQIAPAYNPVMIKVGTAFGQVPALAFIADHEVDDIRPDLSLDQQVTALATARGILGSNFEYIDNLKRHFDALNIVDAHVDELYHSAQKRAQELGVAL